MNLCLNFFGITVVLVPALISWLNWFSVFKRWNFYINTVKEIKEGYTPPARVTNPHKIGTGYLPNKSTVNSYLYHKPS